MADWNEDKSCRHPRKVLMLTAGQPGGPAHRRTRPLPCPVYYRDITGKERVHNAYRCPDCGIRVETDLLVR